MDLARLHELMEVPVIIDGRNLLDPEVVRASGFEYVGMGRALFDPEATRSAAIEYGVGEQTPESPSGVAGYRG